MATIDKRIKDLEGRVRPAGEIPCIEGLCADGKSHEYLNTVTGEITPALPRRGVVIAKVGIRLGDL